MKNLTQLERYNKLVRYIDEQFKTTIDAPIIEEVSFYSYRNINRIFYALQHQTIGQYIKQKKLEKAAEYLKYSNEEVSDIAIDVGYSDLAAFSKAFKKHFNCSPTRYRKSHTLKQIITESIINESIKTKPLTFEIEELPSFKMLYIEYKGSYENLEAIEKNYNKLIKYALKNELFSEESIVVAEVLDDDEITETLNCRYNAGIIVEDDCMFKPEGFFQMKEVSSQKYAKFIHKGTHESCFETYNIIYSSWMTDVQLEFEDKPTLEFYLNDEDTTPKEELITEIYIPIKQ